MRRSANGLRPEEAADDRPLALLDRPQTHPVPRDRPNSALRDPAVVAVDLRKRFGENDVVQGLSFDVEAGSIFGIIGPSGCGKTTTIRMLLGVHKPTSGDLRVLGRQPEKFRR